MTPTAPPWTERRLALAHGTLVLREAGVPAAAHAAWIEAGAPAAAQSVWLMHGISSGAGSWQGLAAALPAHPLPALHLLAWDAPGYGDSAPLAGAAPTAHDYADVAAQALDALGLHRVWLVGHSLGALVAAALAARLGPQRVAGVLLLSPAQGYGARPDPAARVRSQRLQALAELGVPGLAAGLSQRLLSAQATDAHHAQVQAVAQRMTPGGYTQAVQMLCNSDLRALAALSGWPADGAADRSTDQSTDRPTARPTDRSTHRPNEGTVTPGPIPARPPWHIACGSADVVTPAPACAALAVSLGLPFTLLPGAGHACPVQQPGAVAGLIAALATPKAA